MYASGDLDRITYDNGCDHACDGMTWAQTHWDYTKVNLSSSNVSANGTWFKYAIYINYTDGYMQFYLNDQLRTITEYCTADGLDCDNERVYFMLDGYACQYDTNQFKGIQWVYADATSNDTDGDEVASGWMVDDIEVWDGLPTGIGGNRARLPFKFFGKKWVLE
jgi:hypothetical protein